MKIVEIRSLDNEKIKVHIGGKLRNINYDMNAYAELEKLYGSVQKAMDALQVGSIAALRNLLWAGLIHEEMIFNENGEPAAYKITPYQVGSWVMPGDMKMIGEVLAEAIAQSMPPQEVEAARKKMNQAMKDAKNRLTEKN